LPGAALAHLLVDDETRDDGQRQEDAEEGESSLLAARQPPHPRVLLMPREMGRRPADSHFARARFSRMAILNSDGNEEKRSRSEVIVYLPFRRAESLRDSPQSIAECGSNIEAN
jgi:hypothetical protein